MSTIRERHWARRWAVWNGLLWSLGNGMASTTLVIYLAGALHAERFGLSIGLLTAAPYVAGLLRLAAPALMAHCGGRKRFTLAGFFLSAACLAAVPWLAAPGRLPTAAWSLAALILLWCLHHLFQYLAVIGLWSWLADAARLQVRGRFFGRRERWMFAGTALAAIFAGLMDWWAKQLWPQVPAWFPYGVAAAVGAGLMLAALVPLGLMPALGAGPVRKDLHPVERTNASRKKFFRGALWAPFLDARFLPLLLFSGWFSFSNGLTQSAQNFFVVRVLGISLLLSLTLQTTMRLGQWAISPRVGKLADSIGNRPVLIAGQLLTAAGLLCFLAASLGKWYWILGAWVFWVAYAGLNVCLPNLVLKLSPCESNGPYMAAFQAIGGLCFAAGTVLGGLMVDHCQGQPVLRLHDGEIQILPYLFFVGWAVRSVGVLLLLPIAEPRHNKLDAPC